MFEVKIRIMHYVNVSDEELFSLLHCEYNSGLEGRLTFISYAVLPFLCKMLSVTACSQGSSTHSWVMCLWEQGLGMNPGHNTSPAVGVCV